MNESIGESGKQKWYLKWWSVVILLAAIGPFAFPFLWKSKDFNLFWKWSLTIVVSILTFALIWSTWQVLKVLMDQLRLVGLLWQTSS